MRTSHKNHIIDCYLIAGLNKKKIKSVNYPLNSAIKPVPHFDEIPILVVKGFMSSDIDKLNHDDVNDFVDMGKNDNDFKRLSFELIVFNQELIDLRDLCL